MITNQNAEQTDNWGKDAQHQLFARKMGYNDFSVAARRTLIALWCWQLLDISLHIIKHLVTLPHALANTVWWIGVPFILLRLSPGSVAKNAVIGCNILYSAFVLWFWFAYDTTGLDALVFWCLVFGTQVMVALSVYFVTFSPEEPLLPNLSSVQLME